ncbi:MULTISPECIES: 3-carboxy-cis,cis-muconate cycloisomerase [unclassified Micromonospora]|uniref:3-carboxy-cis,cis-muconate cycloisomerase n=1 Tax=unclassified Micromonospora TaxID=2617518 RepID=UPI0022B60FF5|nr:MULTISPECIES: 3-carboxy-cis,cis-muconate cycloisomerase [unclassified Micromonospora]MCZ7422732.1 3-carboxy-cis,cis-muconate cycloisomerase [Verrucosispora sp. WMMA2121]WBB90473.1 3-carboxy-cis,cis-muconate cycloisomerase [Verrucosispora sp. WMMC514]
MRPSSSPSEALLRGLSGTPDVDAELGDHALLRALLDAEAALARAGADVGLLPAEAAEEIVRQCRAERYDPAALGAAAEAAGNPVVPLVRELTAAVAEPARPWVHHGATSQDVLDTALSLVAVRAAGPLLRHLADAADAAAGLARTHRDTLMAARTLGQQAAPTTFGLKAAGWLVGLVEARIRLTRACADLPAQLGGAVGTLAGYGAAGPVMVDRFAAHLGLAASPLPWHTRRQPLLDLAAALGGLLATTGKIALDVGLLAQTEVGEVAEGGAARGGSSAMPHKRNPVDSVLVTAVARRGPGLVGTLFAAAGQEHERATGGWHAEWEPLLDLTHLAGGATARTARMLARLDVRPRRMRANLDASGGLLLAEAVAARLAPALGRAAAHDLVRRAAARPDFRAALLAEADLRAHLSESDVDAALDPAGWLGSAGHLIDRALDLHRDATRGPAATTGPDREATRGSAATTGPNREAQR